MYKLHIKAEAQKALPQPFMPSQGAEVTEVHESTGDVSDFQADLIQNFNYRQTKQSIEKLRARRVKHGKLSEDDQEELDALKAHKKSLKKKQKKQMKASHQLQ